MDVLDPKGIISTQQADLMIKAVLIMLVIVIPVFITLFAFIWKYRASNKSAKYTPNWNHNLKLVFAIWGSIGSIILILGVINWKTTHALDPYKPLDSDKKPITIQVVSLRWKWLFIYPEQNIATVNFLEIPEDTPINFEFTSDSLMNSFWIPQLGGQMYAMPGMRTKLHLMASETGDFAGSAAEINGKGFADMKFTTRSVGSSDFDQWVANTKKSKNLLNYPEYKNLTNPSENNSAQVYVLAQSNLFENIIMEHTMPMGDVK